MKLFLASVKLPHPQPLSLLREGITSPPAPLLVKERGDFLYPNLFIKKKGEFELRAKVFSYGMIGNNRRCTLLGINLFAFVHKQVNSVSF